MTKVLLIAPSDENSSTLSEELQNNMENIDLITVDNYKDGIKNILKSGNNISLALLNYSTPDSFDITILEMLEINNIKTIILCDNPEQLPSKIIFEKECVVDCIIKYYNSKVKNIVNTTNRILNNSKKNILVVEDSKIQLSVLSKILLKMNLNVTKASDGKEALHLIQNSDKKFELILTDYYMPNMDGMQLTLKIREKYDKDEVGIIILSSSKQPEIASQFLKIGANDFINKPYNELEVLTRINSNLDLIELFKKTKDMANKDFLTSAYNRRYFFETSRILLNKAKRNNNKTTVAMIDIDKFKNINDTYGHQCGDKVICAVSDKLHENLRSSDLMARFGGEEFCVMIDNITLEDTKKLFEKIRITIEQNLIECNDNKIQCTISIGIYRGLNFDLENIIKKADEALYYCKRNGRNQIYINNKK